MPTYTDIELNDRALTVQNETDEKANTALRVGSLLVDMIYNKVNKDALDNDGTLAADSAEKVATQQAVKAYIDGLIGAAALIPPGTIDLYAGGGDTIPIGWFLCDGQAISRATYINLFNAIGTSFGIGDGSTTFNVPNIGKRVVAGYDAGDADYDTVGHVGGANAKLIGVTNVPAHSHKVIFSGGTDDKNTEILPDRAIARDNSPESTNSFYRLDRAGAGNAADVGNSSLIGGGVAFDVRSEYVVIPYKIKY